MNDILNHNVNTFDVVEDCGYLLRKEHQLRGDIAIELLNEVIDKNQQYQPELLSVACSVGVIEEKMKRILGVSVYGVDAARHALNEANKRGIITKYTDITKQLPFHDGYFDYVFAGEIIEHILDTKYFLSEIHRVLKPRGYVVITTPNLARFDDRLKLLFGKTPRQTSPLHPYLYLHIRPFTFDSLQNALKACGFTDITLRTHVFTMEFHGKKIILYSRLLTRLLPTLGSTLIVRARKSK